MHSSVQYNSSALQLIAFYIYRVCWFTKCVSKKKINSKCMKLASTRNVTIYREIFAPVIFSSDSSSTSVKFKTERIQNNFLITGLIRKSFITLLFLGKFCISIQSEMVCKCSRVKKHWSIKKPEYSIYGRSKWVTLLYIFRCWVHVHIPCTQ